MFGQIKQLKPQSTIHQQDRAFMGPENWNRIGQDLLELWQQIHGAPEGAASVMVVQSGLMVFLEKPFSQAELALARQSTDNLLPQYIDGLARQMIPVFTDCVKTAIRRQITASSITSNIEQNWMMIYVKFDEPVALSL